MPILESFFPRGFDPKRDEPLELSSKRFILERVPESKQIPFRAFFKRYWNKVKREEYDLMNKGDG